MRACVFLCINASVRLVASKPGKPIETEWRVKNGKDIWEDLFYVMVVSRYAMNKVRGYILSYQDTTLKWSLLVYSDRLFLLPNWFPGPN